MLGRFEAGVIWLSFAATVLIAGWSAPRGFDFLDTGCYYLTYKFPADVNDTHTSYHLFARPLFLLVGEDIAAFRWVSWVMVWASALVFGWGLRSHMRWLYGGEQLLLGRLSTIGICLLSASATYTIKPAALTYNSLNFVAVCVGAGLFLRGSSRLMESDPAPCMRGIAEIAAGAVVATIDLFVKPTTAGYLLGAIFVYCAVAPGISWGVKKRLAFIALVAGAVGTIALLIFVGGWDPFVLRFKTLVGILVNQSFMGDLLRRTGREFGEIASFLRHDLRYALPALAVAGGVLFFLRKTAWHLRAARVAALAVFGLWIFSTIEGRFWRGAHDLYVEGIVARLYLGGALLGSAAAVVSRLVGPATSAGVRLDRRDVGKLLIWGILMITPIAGALGSTTSIYLNGALYSICWLSALLLAASEICAVWKIRAVLPFVTVPFALYATAQLFHGQVQMPYMFLRPLWEQTVPTQVGKEGVEVLLDAPSSAFINDVRRILSSHGFKAGDDIFCFFNIPGLVYAVGGRSPIIPWYFGRIYGGNAVEEYYMQLAGSERRNKAWVITQADATIFREHYQRGGFDFPDGYDEIGRLVNPQSNLEVKLWMRKTQVR